MSLTILILANTGVGLVFLALACGAAYLFARRYMDWPPAWSLAVLALACGACSMSRFIHAITYWRWPRLGTDLMTAADVIACLVGVPSAVVLIYRGIPSALQAPTPAELRRLAEEAAATRVAAEQAAEMARIASIKSQQVDALRAAMSEAAHMDPALKERIERIVEGIR